MLRHSSGRAVIFVSLHQFIAPPPHLTCITVLLASPSYSIRVWLPSPGGIGSVLSKEEGRCPHGTGTGCWCCGAAVCGSHATIRGVIKSVQEEEDL